MIEAANERRRARGAEELTEEGLRARGRRGGAAQIEQREAYMVEQEIDEMLEVKNERRARKGLPPITREESSAKLDGRRVRALIVGGGCRGLGARARAASPRATRCAP